MSPDRYLRSFDVLNLLVQHKGGLRLTEIQDALKLPVSSVHDMLQTESAEESVQGIVGYAIPILETTGSLAAAIHVSVLSKRATKVHERKLLGAARGCAALVEKQLGNYAGRAAMRAEK